MIPGTPLTKEESANNIKEMFKIFKFMVIFINISAVAIAIVEKQLPDIGSKILFCVVLCGVAWIGYFCAKSIADNLDNPGLENPAKERKQS